MCLLSPKPAVAAVLLLSPPMGIPMLTLRPLLFLLSWKDTGMMINTALCADTLVPNQAMFKIHCIRVETFILIGDTAYNMYTIYEKQMLYIIESETSWFSCELAYCNGELVEGARL